MPCSVGISTGVRKACRQCYKVSQLNMPMIGTSMHFAQVHGRYVSHNQVVKPAKRALDNTMARRLWDVSCELTHLKPNYASHTSTPTLIM